MANSECMIITRLIYTSVATRPMEPEDVEAIMHASIRRNSRMDITGLLAYFDQSREFIQLLEGRESDVLSLYRDFIVPDPRHRNPWVIFTELADERLCPDWAMAVQRRLRGQLDEALPLSDFLETGALKGDHNDMARELMIRFRDDVLRNAPTPEEAVLLGSATVLEFSGGR